MKPLGIKCVLYKDEAGNKLILDADNKVAVINNEGLMVVGEDVESFLKEHGFKVIKTNDKIQTVIRDRFNDIK